MSDRFMCNSCDQPKASLEPKKSKIAGSSILLCNTCISKGYEPRYLLIIGYNSTDNVIRKRAANLIKNHLYVGETIALTEVL